MLEGTFSSCIILSFALRFPPFLEDEHMAVSSQLEESKQAYNKK